MSVAINGRRADDDYLGYFNPEHGVQLGASTVVRPLPSGALVLTNRASEPVRQAVIARNTQVWFRWRGIDTPDTPRRCIDLNAAIRRIEGLPPLRVGPKRVWHVLLAKAENAALRVWNHP